MTWSPQDRERRRPSRRLNGSPDDAVHGMTWLALGLLVFVLLLAIGDGYAYWHSRQVPDGMVAQEATVLGYRRTEAGFGPPRNSRYIVFQTPDGQAHLGLYQPRWFTGVEPGDTITVWWDGDRWRSTVEHSWVRPGVWACYGAASLVMMYGWVTVRARARRTVAGTG